MPRYEPPSREELEQAFRKIEQTFRKIRGLPPIDFSDSLFVLDCGCILDGCSESDPGQKWQEGYRRGKLWCEKHGRWELLVNMVNTHG